MNMLLVVFFLLPQANAEVVRDIVYASYGEQTLRLDLYLPERRAQNKVPGVVVVRGGGWRAGDKNGFSRIAQHLASQGFAAACIEYRVLPDNRFPAFVYDTKAAVRWMRANAAKYNIDASAIGAIGGSAGGHLVALLGTSFREKDLEGTGGNANTSSRVQAVVAMAPVVDLTSMNGREDFFDPALSKARRAIIASPITYVDKDSASFLLLHSKADKTVPLEQSQLMLARLKASGVRAELHTLETSPHAFWNGSDFDDTMQRATTFFRKELIRR